MPMESQMKFCSLQNISGASQQNSIAELSLTPEKYRDYFSYSKSPEAPKVHINEFVPSLNTRCFFLHLQVPWKY